MDALLTRGKLTWLEQIALFTEVRLGKYMLFKLFNFL